MADPAPEDVHMAHTTGATDEQHEVPDLKVVMCPCEACTGFRQKHKIKGTSLEEEVSSPSPSDGEESEPEYVAQERSRQHGQLVSLDSQLRMKVYLTTMETGYLEEIMKRHCHEGQVELALKLFGKAESRAVTKQLWGKYMQVINYNYNPAEATSTIMVDFTMAKSLLLSSRALLTNKAAAGSDEACYCLPRTSLMPAGCHHRKINVGATPLSSKKDPWYCSICSMCLRCYKLLGFEFGFHCHDMVWWLEVLS